MEFEVIVAVLRHSLCLYPHRILFYRNETEIPFKEAKAARQLQYNGANEEWNKNTGERGEQNFFWGSVSVQTIHWFNIFYKSCAESAETKSSYSFQSLTNHRSKRTETIWFCSFIHRFLESIDHRKTVAKRIPNENKFCQKNLHHSKSYEKAWEHYQRRQPNQSQWNMKWYVV